MSELCISLFHRFRVRYNETPLPIEGAKVQELLGFLSLFHGTAHPRERLADHLWGEASARQSRRYLSKTLWQLQTSLGAIHDDVAQHLLQIDPDWIRLGPDARLRIDTVILEEAYLSVQGIAGCELTESQAQRLAAAGDCYAGELLEGWYQEWCLVERQRYQYMYLALLDKLIDYCEARQRYDVGVEYASRMLRHDPTRERTHRQIMRLFYQAGDRSAALQHYATCCRILQQQLDVTPDAQTVELYRRIKADQGLDPLRAAVTPHARPVATPAQAPPLAPLLAELLELQSDLALLQHRLGAIIEGLAPCHRGGPRCTEE